MEAGSSPLKHEGLEGDNRGGVEMMFTATQERKQERTDKNDLINMVSKYEKKRGGGTRKK